MKSRYQSLLRTLPSCNALTAFFKDNSYRDGRHVEGIRKRGERHVKKDRRRVEGGGRETETEKHHQVLTVDQLSRCGLGDAGRWNTRGEHQVSSPIEGIMDTLDTLSNISGLT